ncbi:uncharacterized protein [Palaemon carinicauda]|uniref:uncharacterized protein n=1 Tax=Palaemon carinicauda TaxID=392227 RepID=UPI0035B68540
MAASAMVLDNIGCVNTGCDKDINIIKETLKAHDEVVVPLLKCERCESNYCDDHMPRNLSCGHTMCTSCIEAMLVEEKSCPECHKRQKSDTKDKLHVNYQLLRLTRVCKTKEIKLGSGNRAVLFGDVSNHPINDELWKCNAHDSPKVLFCRSCNVWVCENCLVLDHPLPPRGTCRVLQLTDALYQIRKKYDEVATNIQKDIDTMTEDFQLEFRMHNFFLKHCSEERSHQRLVKKLEPLLAGTSEGNAEEVRKANDRLKKMIDSFHATDFPEEITTACKELLDFQEELKPIIKQEKERLTKARPSMLVHFSMDIKRLAESQVPIYAIFQEDEIHRWSRLFLVNGRLLLPALNEGTPPGDGIKVPYQYIEMLLGPRERTVFIEVETNEKTSLGRVFIKLPHYNPLTRQMFLMCSGQKGVSYRNTELFQNEKGRLSGGDYLRSDGSKGGTIVKGLGNCCTGLLCIRDKKGGVLGEMLSTRFHIFLRRPDRTFSNALGMVTEGFQVVEAVAKSGLVTKARVKDCGIFIPMNQLIEVGNTDVVCHSSRNFSICSHLYFRQHSAPFHGFPPL